MLAKKYSLKLLEDLQLYASLLGRDRFEYFWEMEKNKKMLKHVQYKDLKLTFRQAIELVIEYMDLMLLASMQQKTLQITKKIYKIKDSFLFYFVIGSQDKKLGFRILAENEWFKNFMQFQTLIKNAMNKDKLQWQQQAGKSNIQEIKYLEKIIKQQIKFKQQWEQWQQMITKPHFYNEMCKFRTINEQIHHLINSFNYLELNQRYSSKVRLIKYLISNKIIHFMFHQSTQKTKMQQQVHQALFQLHRQKVISNLNSFVVQNTQQEMEADISYKFTAKNNFTKHYTFLIPIGSKTQQFRADINLQTITKSLLHDLARQWVRCQVQFSFIDGENHLSIKTEPFWRIYSQKFAELETVFLSSVKQITRMLVSETKHTFYFDPTRLAFSRWSKKIETGLSLQQTIKITNNNISLRELILCSLDRQMLIWSTFENDLQEENLSKNR